MTVPLPDIQMDKIAEDFPDATKLAPGVIAVNKEDLSSLAARLKESPELAFDYLNYITAIDYFSHFELVYQTTSLKHNHSLVIKTRCDRSGASVPSITGVWKGADFQEREVYDLMGIRFEGHPDLKRIFLWEGFEGHPLRKDYL